jgi:uncharacterized membrane protein YdbT with pleckstrin-like domain
MARYTDGLLMDGEYVVYRTLQHPFARFYNARFGILAVVLSLVFLFLATRVNDQGPVGTGFGWLVAILLFGGIANIVWVFYAWYQDDYVVTSRRVIKIEGILNKSAADSSLEKINDAILTQSMFGRMFDWGDLRILTAAEEVADDYHRLHHAKIFKKSMLQQKQDLEDALARKITAPIQALAQQDADAAKQRADEAAAKTAAAAARPAEPTVEEKLRQLAALRDQGLITPDDYEAKKTAILALM